MRKLANEEINRLVNGVNVNNTTNQLCQRCEPHELLTLAKCVPQKRCVSTVRNVRKETEKFGRGLREVLVKKGCKMGGVSL